MKADELDKFFLEEFGSIWCPIMKQSRGSFCPRMEFKLPMRRGCVETKFFGDSLADNLISEVSEMANVTVLALWDNVSIEDNYGAVIRPKAIQIRVCDVPQLRSYIDSDNSDECL